MKRRSAFTLMEVLLALAIVAILAGVAGLAVMPNLNKGKYRGAQFQVERFKSALEQYLLDNGAPPTRQQGLAALVAAPTLPPVPASFPAGGYLDKLEIPLDPWGREYAYFVPGPAGKPFDVVCYGADGEEGGDGWDADISCWK